MIRSMQIIMYLFLKYFSLQFILFVCISKQSVIHILGFIEKKHSGIRNCIHFRTILVSIRIGFSIYLHISLCLQLYRILGTPSFLPNSDQQKY